jgi:hypothetical protein
LFIDDEDERNKNRKVIQTDRFILNDKNDGQY